jgi:hypothetical protein
MGKTDLQAGQRPFLPMWSNETATSVPQWGQGISNRWLVDIGHHWAGIFPRP